MPGLSNWCTFAFGQPIGRDFISATELDINSFWPSPLGGILWYLITQVNNALLAAYITFFDPSRGKCRFFIPFLVYALVYLSIDSNLVTLDTPSTKSDSVYTHTCYPFSRKPLLRWSRTVKTGILINW